MGGEGTTPPIFRFEASEFYELVLGMGLKWELETEIEARRLGCPTGVDRGQRCAGQLTRPIVAFSR